MSKSVLDTISTYVKDPQAAERIATADLELELCDRMVGIRMQKKMTQAELAEAIGCSQAHVAKLENGAYDRCGIGTLRRFARALGYEIDIERFLVPSDSMSRRRGYLGAIADLVEHLEHFMHVNEEPNVEKVAYAAETSSEPQAA